MKLISGCAVKFLFLSNSVMNVTEMHQEIILEELNDISMKTLLFPAAQISSLHTLCALLWDGLLHKWLLVKYEFSFARCNKWLTCYKIFPVSLLHNLYSLTLLLVRKILETQCRGCTVKAWMIWSSLIITMLYVIRIIIKILRWFVMQKNT